MNKFYKVSSSLPSMKKAVMLALVFVVFLSLASADFEIDDDYTDIEQNYLGGLKIKGKINMSFEEQENEMFNSNFDGGARLYDVLKNMSYDSGEDFACTPFGCRDGYSPSDGTTSKEKNVNGTGFFGFVMSGNNIVLEELRFKLENVNGQASCTSQVSADLLSDEKIEFYNNKIGSGVCGEKAYGCFNFSEESDWALVGSQIYCEKINLTSAPGYKVGAIFKTENVVNNDKMKVTLRDSAGAFKKDCSLPVGDLLGGDEDVSIDCIMNYSSDKNWEAVVCVENNEDLEGYKIKFNEKDSNSCGYSKLSSSASLVPEGDFAIFAQPMQYAAFGSVNAEYKDGKNENTLDEMNNYLEEQYDNDCPSDTGCVLPLKVSALDKNMKVSSVYVKYRSGNIGKDSDKVYELEVEPFLIDSDFLILDLEKMNFIAPNEEGDETFELRLGDEEILEEEVKIEVGLDFSVLPNFAYIGAPTIFTAFSDENISSSIWDFGNGTIITSDNNRVEHRYTKQGNYQVEVTMVNDDGDISIKMFQIVVGEPKESANRTLNEYKDRVDGIKSFLSSKPGWIKSELEEGIQLAGIESSLTEISNDYESLPASANDSEYLEIIDDLIELDVPKSLFVSSSGNVPAELGFDGIDVGLIEEVSDSDVDDEEDAKNKIIGWMYENYDVTIEFEKFSADWDGGSEAILADYKLVVSPVNADADEAYLFIGNDFSEIVFKQDYEAEEIASGNAAYIYFASGSSAKNIEFLINGEAPEVSELGVYISPVVSELGVELPICNPETDPECAIPGFNWVLFLIGLAVMLFMILIVYIVLQEWYKRNYERHLFRNPDDLYNIINFIYNSRAAGLKDNYIANKLKDRRWSNEQVRYAFRKIDGKRTGMWEIPLFKHFENKKVRKEIEKKNPGRQIDARFIKRANQ